MNWTARRNSGAFSRHENHGISTIICLASSREVILLDEPVLGFDAIMRVEFYELLKESFQKHPRIIIVSTHIIEEIARTIQKLIIIDKGNIRFFDTLESIHPMSLQDFFIQTVGHKGGAANESCFCDCEAFACQQKISFILTALVAVCATSSETLF